MSAVDLENHDSVASVSYDLPPKEPGTDSSLICYFKNRQHPRPGQVPSLPHTWSEDCAPRPFIPGTVSRIVSRGFRPVPCEFAAAHGAPAHALRGTGGRRQTEGHEESLAATARKDAKVATKRSEHAEGTFRHNYLGIDPYCFMDQQLVSSFLF